MALPATIKALQIQQDRSLKVVDIPFASQEKVKNLAPDEVILKIHAVGLNPTGMFTFLFFTSFHAFMLSFFTLSLSFFQLLFFSLSLILINTK